MAKIPSIGKYRGVRIHDRQPADRIEKVVKPQIDLVHAMADVALLARYAANSGNAPESRLFAAAKIEATWQIAAEERRLRPEIDLDKIRASTAGLDCLTWRDPARYGSLLDIGVAVSRERDLNSTPPPKGTTK